MLITLHIYYVISFTKTSKWITWSKQFVMSQFIFCLRVNLLYHVILYILFQQEALQRVQLRSGGSLSVSNITGDFASIRRNT